MDAIYEGTIIGNKIMFENDVLKDLYIRNSKYYQTSPGSLHRANASITPYNLPFFHLGAEPYYHIKWKEGVIPPPQAQSPSNKYLKGNVDFAFLDNELWDLLHDETLRLELRNALIEKFLI
jgi:putative restriction endonuclease